MITELEKQFYKTFEIEPIPIKSYGYWLIKGSIAENGKGEKVVYPEITDRRLLEMICINSQKGGIAIFNRKNIEELKNSMIQHCIDRLGYALNKEQYKQQIQSLFKEGE